LTIVQKLIRVLKYFWLREFFISQGDLLIALNLFIILLLSILSIILRLSNKIFLLYSLI